MKFIVEVEVEHKGQVIIAPVLRCVCGSDSVAIADYRKQALVCDCGRVFVQGKLTGEIVEFVN